MELRELFEEGVVLARRGDVAGAEALLRRLVLRPLTSKRDFEMVAALCLEVREPAALLYLVWKYRESWARTEQLLTVATNAASALELPLHTYVLSKRVRDRFRASVASAGAARNVAAIEPMLPRLLDRYAGAPDRLERGLGEEDFRVLTSLGAWEEARTLAEKLSAENPTALVLQNNLAYTKWALGDVSDALAGYDHTLSQDRENAFAAAHRVHCLVTLGKDASSALGELAALPDSELTDAMFLKPPAFAIAGEHERVLAACERLLNDSAENVITRVGDSAAVFGVGAARFLGRNEKARELLSTLQRRVPGSKLAEVLSEQLNESGDEAFGPKYPFPNGLYPAQFHHWLRRENGSRASPDEVKAKLVAKPDVIRVAPIALALGDESAVSNALLIAEALGKDAPAYLLDAVDAFAKGTRGGASRRKRAAEQVERLRR